MESSLIKYLKETQIEDITNITDAMYESDPNGTKANAAYFYDNVHIYFKHFAAALLTENTKIVSKAFELNSETIGDPYYTTVAAAYAGLSNPGASNKAYIYLTNCGTEYNETLSFGTDGYTVIDGSSKFGTALNGSISISEGSHIFRNIKFKTSIEISGGTVLFENCDQSAGTTNISGTSTVIISGSGQWGNITMENDLTNVNLWCENIQNMLKDTNNHSISVPNDLISPQIVIRRVAAQGDLNDPGALVKEISGFEPFITARPII
jgi:hypothetical protein